MNALNLFLSLNQVEADEYAKHLNSLNSQRQRITEKDFLSQLK